MIEKLKKAYLGFQKSSLPNPQSHFFRTDPDTGKKSKVSLITGPAGLPLLTLTKSDVNLHATLSSDLHQIMNATHLPQVQSGDRVVMLAAGPTPQLGAKFHLDASDWYFAMNGGPILCNGQQLGYNFQGAFLQRFTAKCGSGTATQYYDELKLI